MIKKPPGSLLIQMGPKYQNNLQVNGDDDSDVYSGDDADNELDLVAPVRTQLIDTSDKDRPQS